MVAFAIVIDQRRGLSELRYGLGSTGETPMLPKPHHYRCEEGLRLLPAAAA
jgi:hypothetical protein